MFRLLANHRPNRRLPEAPHGSQGRRQAWLTLGEWLHEPLLHFLLIGALIFAGFNFLGPPANKGDQGDRIVLTEDDLRQLAVQWLAQGRPPPSPDQMRSLIDDKVNEEILFREAMALGLDKNDEIIRRRLAQKMDFLAEDVAALAVPSEAELKSWFAQNSARFALPPRVSFRHLYFSLDRGPTARDAAAAALAKVADKPELTTAAADAFMFQDYYAEKTPEQVTREFGPDFTKAVFRLEPGAWRGPVLSGYGWHLIFVRALGPGRVPAFEEVETDVKAAWLDEKQRELKRSALEAMRARYTVVVPPIETLDWGSLTKLPVAATEVLPE
jgi:parvulin-like peptidyl-prolyl isomerase